MRIIAFIEDYKIVKKILDYLGIYESQRKRPPPGQESAASVGKALGTSGGKRRK